LRSVWSQTAVPAALFGPSMGLTPSGPASLFQIVPYDSVDHSPFHICETGRTSVRPQGERRRRESPNDKAFGTALAARRVSVADANQPALQKSIELSFPPIFTLRRRQ